MFVLSIAVLPPFMWDISEIWMTHFQCTCMYHRVLRRSQTWIVWICCHESFVLLGQIWLGLCWPVTYNFNTSHISVVRGLLRKSSTILSIAISFLRYPHWGLSRRIAGDDCHGNCQPADTGAQPKQRCQPQQVTNHRSDNKVTEFFCA